MGFGATKETWEAYRDDGWLPMMLPVVSDPKAKIDPQSKLKALGKPLASSRLQRPSSGFTDGQQ